VTSLDFKYDPNSEDAFFEQHFLQTECFRNVELGGETVKLFYNKFPLLNFHGLLIPGNYRQSFNSKQDHVKKDLVQWIWGVLAEAEGAFTIGFNPFGGYASRNQLHFQISLDPQEFGITDPVWDINGGDQQYPAHVDLCKSPDELQSWLDAVYTQDNAAFNLLIIKEKDKGSVKGQVKAYAFKRKFQSTYDCPRWTSGFAFAEMAGRIVISNAEDYTTLTADMVKDHLGEISIDAQTEVNI